MRGIQNLSELSKLSGINYHTIYNLKKREHARPNYADLAAIAHVLDMPIEAFSGNLGVPSQGSDEFVQKYRALSEPSRAVVDNLIQSLLERERN